MATLAAKMRQLVRQSLIVPIRCYQLCLSPYFPASCRYHPSCSTYAVEAITRHGVFRGSWLAIQRVLRCNPWSLGGHDPVPSNPECSRTHCTPPD